MHAYGLGGGGYARSSGVAELVLDHVRASVETQRRGGSAQGFMLDLGISV